MKKLNKYILALIIFGSLALIFLGFSIGSAFYTVNRAESSIDEIGKIVVDEDLSLNKSKERLDKAIENYNKLDRNINLDQKVENISLLVEKKKEFVNTSIILAKYVDSQKVRLELSDSDIAKYVLNVDEYQKEYITLDEFKELSNYANYLDLYEKYKDKLNTSNDDSSSSNNNESEEEIEIC